MMIFRIVILIIIAGLTACAAPSAPRPVNPAYEMVVNDLELRKRLQDWFNCDECVNGQLRRVQELGNFAVGQLDTAMGGVVIQVSGVDITLADNDVAMLTGRCNRFTTGLPGALTTAVTTAQCVNRFQAQSDQRYRARAREALLAIRTDNACNRLRTATGTDLCDELEPFFPPVNIGRSGRSIREITVP